MKTASEEISLQTTTENRQWLCRRDVVWQTVPNSRGGDRKSLVAITSTAAYGTQPVRLCHTQSVICNTQVNV